MMTLSQALLAQLKAGNALLSESNPFNVCLRLTVFASRMHEVTNPDTLIEMSTALAGIHQNALSLLSGHSVDIIPVATPAAHTAGAVGALMQYGIIFGAREDEILEQISACVNEMFGGLDLNLAQEVAASKGLGSTTVATLLQQA